MACVVLLVIAVAAGIEIVARFQSINAPHASCQPQSDRCLLAIGCEHRSSFVGRSSDVSGDRAKRLWSVTRDLAVSVHASVPPRWTAVGRVARPRRTSSACDPEWGSRVPLRS